VKGLDETGRAMQQMTSTPTAKRASGTLASAPHAKACTSAAGGQELATLM